MRILKLLCMAGVAAIIFNLAGCATPATSQAMTVKPGTTAAVNQKLKGAVSVKAVSGGKETSPLWTSQVDNAGFQKALQDSLAISGYLAPDASQVRYTVSAELLQLQQPFMGFTFDVASDVRYQLSGPAGVRAYPVKATGTATVSDAFAGVERLRIANERSVLENIKSFINQLAAFTE